MELYNVVTFCTDVELIKKTLGDMTFKYIGILHDRDEKKKPHVHLILSSDAQLPYRKLAEMLQEKFNQNVFVQGVKDFCMAEDYLCHEHNRSKAKYEQSEKFTNDADFFKNLYTINYHRDDSLVQELITGEWDIIALAQKYGLDFVKNFKTYEYFHTCIVNRLEEDRIQNDLYLERVRQNAIAQQRRYDEITKICEDFGVTRETVGDWVYQDYERAYDWVRKYRRYKQENIVYIFVLRKLDEITRLSMEKLIYKRMSDGISQIFVEDDPYHKTIDELRAQHIAGLPVPCFRRNIYLKASEYEV